MGTDGNYGTVDGERPDLSEALKTDPFESLLGICRVLGFHYEVKQHDGRWSCTLRHWNWPADFFGGAGSQNHRRSFGTVNASTRLDALKSTFISAVLAMSHNCWMWREIAKENPALKGWFDQAIDGAKAKPYPCEAGSAKDAPLA